MVEMTSRSWRAVARMVKIRSSENEHEQLVERTMSRIECVQATELDTVLWRNGGIYGSDDSRRAGDSRNNEQRRRVEATRNDQE